MYFYFTIKRVKHSFSKNFFDSLKFHQCCSVTLHHPVDHTQPKLTGLPAKTVSGLSGSTRDSESSLILSTISATLSGKASDKSILSSGSSLRLNRKVWLVGTGGGGAGRGSF